MKPGRFYRIVENGTVIAGVFHKEVKTDRYQTLFNLKTGFEVLRGLDGTDPWMLDLPSLIDCGIMGHCHNTCDFCYQGDNHQPNMPIEEFKKIIDQVKHHVNQIALGGRGDPNLHENFKEIVEYCNENDVMVNYTTSGKGLTDDQVEISKNCGAVAVSNYNEDFTYSALKKFFEAGIQTNIHFVLSQPSFDNAINLLQGKDIYEGKVDLKRLDGVVFLLFKPQGRGKNLDNWVMSNYKLKIFIKEIRKAKNDFDIGLDACLVNKISQLDKFTKTEELCADTCEGARMSCYITPDSKLVPCSFGHNDDGESLKEVTFKDAWDNSEAFINFRNCLKENPDVCPYFKGENDENTKESIEQSGTVSRE